MKFCESEFSDGGELAPQASYWIVYLDVKLTVKLLVVKSRKANYQETFLEEVELLSRFCGPVVQPASHWSGNVQVWLLYMICVETKVFLAYIQNYNLDVTEYERI